MATMAVALDRNLFLAYYSSFLITSSSALERQYKNLLSDENKLNLWTKASTMCEELVQSISGAYISCVPHLILSLCSGLNEIKSISVY